MKLIGSILFHTPHMSLPRPRSESVTIALANCKNSLRGYHDYEWSGVHVSLVISLATGSQVDIFGMENIAFSKVMTRANLQQQGFSDVFTLNILHQQFLAIHMGKKSGIACTRRQDAVRFSVPQP
jgi:hypothetical protein